MKTELTAIIPTYNNVNGLKYLLSYFKDKDCQIIVVDNKTSKEKNNFIASLFHCYKDRLIYLPQEKNLGFARAVNLGARYATGDWLLILNDDIEFESQKSKVKSQKYNSKVKSYQSNIIEELIKEAERKKLDAVSPVLRNPDGGVENYGYKVLPYGKVELVKSVKSVKSVYLDGLTAACLLIKTSVFKKLGGFDESFFAYLEDVDFFLRLAEFTPIKSGLAQDKSFGIAYDIEVLHNHMTTTKTMGNFKARQDIINWWRLFFKHPDKFKFDWQFVIERLRNVLGFIKASLK
ncbi:MAG: glycosyltransferase [Candidatus Roizmanbacteria bacterium]|nr:glycosyltransferase [Candidatus Roizmanbacteria bacterium]